MKGDKIIPRLMAKCPKTEKLFDSGEKVDPGVLKGKHINLGFMKSTVRDCPYCGQKTRSKGHRIVTCSRLICYRYSTLPEFGNQFLDLRHQLTGQTIFGRNPGTNRTVSGIVEQFHIWIRFDKFQHSRKFVLIHDGSPSSRRFKVPYGVRIKQRETREGELGVNTLIPHYLCPWPSILEPYVYPLATEDRKIP